MSERPAGLWYRVFGSRDAVPEPAGVAACLAGLGVPVRFSGGDAAWTGAAVAVGGGELTVDRWTTDEEGIRDELNAWAGYLETCEGGPHHGPLMERTIQARQLFVLRRPEGAGDEACVALCRHLAEATAGFYHADGVGFFDADGTLLVKEEERD